MTTEELIKATDLYPSLRLGGKYMNLNKYSLGWKHRIRPVKTFQDWQKFYINWLLKNKTICL